MLAYYFFFEGIWARTPGKLVLGTRVVSQHGDKPAFGQVVGRTLCRFIPFDALSFFGEEGWHDSIPKTQVVLVRRQIK
ncbi:MAG: RDD family protein [Rhodanobacter sp.]